jgi:hypothetical protein
LKQKISVFVSKMILCEPHPKVPLDVHEVARLEGSFL